MLNIQDLMNALARDRPVFHSEADFQHALAWRIHEAIPDCECRLECKPFRKKPMYLDIWLHGIDVALELKYLTRQLDIECKGEFFALRYQGTQAARYDFLKDIQRLEKLRNLPNAKAGFAILLTNEPTYWKSPSHSNTVDEAFRLHEGRSISGERAWSEQASPGTIQGREEPIYLDGSYDLHWQDYSYLGERNNHRFRYLAVQMSYGEESL